MSQPEAYIDPQMRVLLRQIQAEGEVEFDWANITEEEVIALRADAVEADNGPAAEPRPDLFSVTDLEIPGAYGNCKVRCYRASDNDQATPALIYLHGGGWVGGSTEDRDDGLRILATASDCMVMSVDYVLAPEYKFPGPLDDVVAVCRWIKDHAFELGVDQQALALAGDSAGANLALAAAIDLRNAEQPFISQMLLFYGVYEHDHTTESHRLYGEDETYTLSSNAMDCCWRMYLRAPDQDKDPRAAPLLAQMQGLPSTYIMCGSLDPLLDDSRKLHRKMSAAMVDTHLKIYPGVTHSFLSFIPDVGLAEQAWIDAGSFLKEQLNH